MEQSVEEAESSQAGEKQVCSQDQENESESNAARREYPQRQRNYAHGNAGYSVSKTLILSHRASFVWTVVRHEHRRLCFLFCKNAPTRWHRTKTPAAVATGLDVQHSRENGTIPRMLQLEDSLSGVRVEEVCAGHVHDEFHDVALAVLEGTACPYDDRSAGQRCVDERLTAHHLDE